LAIIAWVVPRVVWTTDVAMAYAIPASMLTAITTNIKKIKKLWLLLIAVYLIIKSDCWKAA
jgi:hypothetical protein